MEKPLLEKASFEFTQEADCVSHPDQSQTIEIEFVSDLGVDRDNGGFFILKTARWAIENEKDLRILFDRIEQIIKKQQSQ